MSVNLNEYQRVLFISSELIEPIQGPRAPNVEYFMNSLSALLGTTEINILISNIIERITYFYSNMNYHFCFKKITDMTDAVSQTMVLTAFIPFASVSLMRKGVDYLRLFIEGNPEYEQILRKNVSAHEDGTYETTHAYSGKDSISNIATNKSYLKNEAQPINASYININNPSSKSGTDITNEVEEEKTHGLRIDMNNNSSGHSGSTSEYETITSSARVKFYKDLEGLIQYIRKEWFDPYIIELSCNNY